MKNYVFILLTILVGGCTTAPNSTIVPISIDVPKKIHIDQRILEKCLPLKSLEKSATFEEVLVISTKNAEIYYDCRIKQENSIKLIKEFSNLQESK